MYGKSFVRSDGLIMRTFAGFFEWLRCPAAATEGAPVAERVSFISERRGDCPVAILLRRRCDPGEVGSRRGDSFFEPGDVVARRVQGRM